MKKQIMIEGMSCGHCVKHVQNALSELAGVGNVTVDLKDKNAIVELTAEVSDADLKNVVEEAGYDVVSIVKL